MRLAQFFRQEKRIFLLALASAIAIPAHLPAAGTVTVCDEAHLRTALAGGGLVNFAADGTIVLSNTLLITNGTTIDATGHAVTLSGSNAVRILYINPGVNASLIHLQLANGFFVGSTAATASAFGQPGAGAAVFNEGGTVALTGCTLVSNTVVGGAGYQGFGAHFSSGGPGQGAAIWNSGGSVSVTNCNFLANRATGGAGAPFDSAFPPGSGGDGMGAAIGSLGGSLSVESSVIISNNVTGGAPADPGSVGAGAAGGGYGGAIWTSNTAAIYSTSAFAGNMALGGDETVNLPGGYTLTGSAMGGALFATNGTATCGACTFSGNQVVAGHRNASGWLGQARGGAIWSHASIALSQCVFSGNQALGNGVGWHDSSTPGGEGSGGAIFNDASMSVSASSFTGNAAIGGAGGFSGNNAFSGGNGIGGAIANVGTLNATNCTVTSNAAIGSDAGFRGGPAVGGSGMGGGLGNLGGTMFLVNLTVSSNQVQAGVGAGADSGSPLGGGIFTTNGTVNLLNTILAFSTPSGSNGFGTLTDLGYNISSDGSCNFTGPGSLNNTDPKLGPLDSYGGPTLTMALLAGSPAIDAGSPGGFPSTDQRSHARPFGTACDIGAFESSPPYVIRGLISGSTLRDEVSVTTGANTVSTTNHLYGLENLGGGNYSVTPQSAGYIFIPANRSITVGPDQLGINFSAYHWNALSLDDATNNVLHVISAITNGQTVRLQTSTDLKLWSSLATNTIGSSNYWELFLPVGSEPERLYRLIFP